MVEKARSKCDPCRRAKRKVRPTFRDCQVPILGLDALGPDPRLRHQCLGIPLNDLKTDGA